jgi:hypothetical protein
MSRGDRNAGLGGSQLIAGIAMLFLALRQFAGKRLDAGLNFLQFAAGLATRVRCVGIASKYSKGDKVGNRVNHVSASATDSA